MFSVSARDAAGLTPTNIEPRGYVALLELPGGHLLATLACEDISEVREMLSSLVPEGVRVTTRAIVPVVADPVELTAAVVEAMRS